jgi:simple sugar transport system ATP-binding protein
MSYLEMHGITKRFPGVVANSNVNFQVEQGEIHALVGENGAGKTTLMNILYGLYSPDAGEILLDGRPVKIPNPHTAIRLGIGMVHQHFQLVPSLTVAENVVLGYEPRRSLFVDDKQMLARVRNLSKSFGVRVDPQRRVADLSVGEQQRVEILKLLYRDARLLVFDEPTAVLTPQEAQELFQVMRRLVAEGRTAVFITHKLDEIMTICRAATVLRRGSVVGVVQVAESSSEEIARLMVGREVESVQRLSHYRPGSPGLALAKLDARDERELPALRQISFVVHTSEILGLAGVEGNGQRELAEVLVGNRQAESGTIMLAGRVITRLSGRKRRELGMSFIPEDRNGQGVSGKMTIWENNISNSYYRPPVSKWRLLNIKFARDLARKLIKAFDIRTRDETTVVGTLSGGNAQKVIIARELAHVPTVLVAAQPTRGLDVGAAKFVHEQLLQLRDAGVAVLLISADLDELLALADRIAVIYEGRIQKTILNEDASREELGLLMAGKRKQKAGPGKA